MYNLCQYNEARALTPLDDPLLSDFVGAQDALYNASDVSPGFVWRLADETGGTGSVRPFEDKQILVGLSVWRDVPSLKEFVYGKEHAGLIRRRGTWFEAHKGANYVLWWKRAGELPTVAEGRERLAQLRLNGPTLRAFDFKTHFAPPAILVGSLGPTGTNSEKAAEEYMSRECVGGELLLFDTFEEVAGALLEGGLDRAVVCTAYLKFSALYFERVPRLRMVESFVADLHPMVVAARPGFDRSLKPTFTVQPAILPLIRRYAADVNFLPAASNASAAHDVAVGKAEACLTTEVVALACGLEVLIRMPPLQIPFVVFERSNSEGAMPDELVSFFNPTSVGG